MAWAWYWWWRLVHTWSGTLKWPFLIKLGYSVAEVGKIVLFQLFAKQCSSNPNNNIDIVSVSCTNILEMFSLNDYQIISPPAGCSRMGKNWNGFTECSWSTRNGSVQCYTHSVSPPAELTLSSQELFRQCLSLYCHQEGHVTTGRW